MLPASSALERRILRLTVVASTFAVAAAAFGMWPAGIAAYPMTWFTDDSTWVATSNAGGKAVLGWAAMQVSAAYLVRQRPTRVAGIGWILAAIVIDIAGAFGWLFENFSPQRHDLLPAGKMMLVCAGAASVLVLLVLPVVLLASGRTTPTVAPSARVVGR